MKIKKDFVTKNGINLDIDANIFVYDRFCGEIILANKMDVYAPPERYHYVSCRVDDEDIYTDTFWVDITNKKYIDFSYHYNESWNVDEEKWTECLYTFFESHGLPRTYYSLRERRYPRKRFINLLKQYYSEV